MCLILFAYRVHPEYPLIVTANRDEFYHRKTRSAQWWPEAPHLLGGKDLEADGTWLGISQTGRFAAVTNIREPHITSPAPCSRGLLPRRYLEEELDNKTFSGLLEQTKDQYLGYNLIYGNIGRLNYYSNRSDRLTILKPGIYGLSNAQLDTAWPKVVSGKSHLTRLLEDVELKTEKLLEVLASTAIARNDQLPQTGVSLDWERKLSAIRIIGPEYGTRSSTAVLIDKIGKIIFHEKTLAPTIKEEIKISFQHDK